MKADYPRPKFLKPRWCSLHHQNKRNLSKQFSIFRKIRRRTLGTALKDSDCFEIRISGAIPATVLLIDDGRAFCRTGVKIDNLLLWSSAPSFVAMIKDYLETKWESLEKRALWDFYCCCVTYHPKEFMYGYL
jgi:hypothetical protein